MSTNPMWPRYSTPDDLAAIEPLPLALRGLPTSTYAALARATAEWPEHDVRADTEDSATVVTITVEAHADHQVIDDILARYALTYRITER